MTLYELINKSGRLGRIVTSAEIPVYIDNVKTIKNIELCQNNNENYYVNINTDIYSSEVITGKSIITYKAGQY